MRPKSVCLCLRSAEIRDLVLHRVVAVRWLARAEHIGGARVIVACNVLSLKTTYDYGG